MMKKEQSNQPLQLTATVAAHSVLRPLCLLLATAAEWHVGQTQASTHSPHVHPHMEA
jgi:hypothetical protein